MTVPYYYYYYLGGIFSSCYATLLNISFIIIYDYYPLLLSFNFLSMTPSRWAASLRRNFGTSLRHSRDSLNCSVLGKEGLLIKHCAGPAYLGTFSDYCLDNIGLEPSAHWGDELNPSFQKKKNSSIFRSIRLLKAFYCDPSA